MADGDLAGFEMFDGVFPDMARVNAQGQPLRPSEPVDEAQAADPARPPQIGGERHVQPAEDCLRCMADLLEFGETFIDASAGVHLDVPTTRSRLLEEEQQ
jgi:hypothetical protein